MKASAKIYIAHGFPFVPGGFCSHLPGFKAGSYDFKAAAAIFCSFPGEFGSNPRENPLNSPGNSFHPCAKIPFAPGTNVLPPGFVVVPPGPGSSKC